MEQLCKLAIIYQSKLVLVIVNCKLIIVNNILGLYEPTLRLDVFKSTISKHLPESGATLCCQNHCGVGAVDTVLFHLSLQIDNINSNTI